MSSKIIQNYHLKEELGAGQYGKVYRAEDQKSRQTVAIKVMNVSKFKSTPKLSEFTSNEINILSKISSPHIIRFVEMLRTMNNFYLVYEFCNGGTLGQLLEKRKVLPESEALTYFSQIMEAFRVLAKQNILHRDLKPTNILFHDGMIKLADFGFCKELLKETDMTQTMVGSPIYMAPEILKGQIYNCKADIWSMGVVLYEMLFGVCPFEERSIATLVNLIENKPLQLPLNVNRISESTQQLLRRMLVVDPNRRISPTELLAYRLNKPAEQPKPVKKTDRTDEICQFNRQHIEYLMETLYKCMERSNCGREEVLMTFLLYKMLYCYQKELRRKSRYWQVARQAQPNDGWDRMIDAQLEKLEPIGTALKQSLMKVTPTIKLKIEIETVYPDLTTVLQFTQALPDNDVLKLQVATALLMYKHIHNALERNEMNFEKVLSSNDAANIEQAVNRKMEKCRQFIRNQL